MEKLKPTHRLKRFWRVHPVECPEESFGPGSLVHIIRRKTLPDVVCFLGRKAHRLGCAFYDIDVNPDMPMILEKLSKRGGI